MTTSFIGIDLAWKVDGNHTGGAVLEGSAKGVRLTAVSTGIRSLGAVVDFVAAHARADAVVAIDGPLIVSNRTGQRPCETQMARRFWRQGASCHSNNLTRTPAPAGVRLVAALGTRGFRHDFELDGAKGRRGRWVMEVYPHPALIRLFGLPRILAYKKGAVPDRRRGLGRLQAYLLSLATDGRGLLMTDALGELCTRDLDALAGRRLKEHEDSLDATLCAYLAFHAWRFGAARNEMIGDLTGGYIVVPCAPGPT